jgi:probable phosphoglycerate mutase
MARFVIRPGETSFDGEHRVQGRLDLPLNQHGRDQLEEIVQRMRGSGVSVIYSSPMEPALSTAKYVAECLDVPCRPLEQLSNVHMGLWQGMTWEEIRQKQPRVFRHWEETPEAVCPPEGETCLQAYQRVLKALKAPMRRVESFAVVAPEPVASIVACVLSRTPLRVSPPLTAWTLVEEIHNPAQPARSFVGRWLEMTVGL